MISRFYKANKELVDKQYRIFKSKVNMTYAEMVEWKKNKCSRAASIKIDEVINRVTRLLKKSKTTWTQKDFNDSKKVVSYISRATKIQDSLTPAKRTWGCMKGKNFYALRNWAYDREKEKKRRPRRNPKLLDQEDIDGFIYRLEQTLWSGSYAVLPRLITYSKQRWKCDDCGKDDLICRCEYCTDCGLKRCMCNFMELSNDESKDKVRLAAWKLAKESLSNSELQKVALRAIDINPHLSHFNEYPQILKREMLGLLH